MIGRTLGEGSTEKGEPEGSLSDGPGIRGDETNILVLLFLYILQGIPLGLAGAIPLILTNRNVRCLDWAS
jgi:PAT family acetyl-CoA transporter-like MFS transporter 1